MTPEERDLIADLFARLAQLERNPRDAAAERAIGEGLRRAPNAIYALVQTVLVQDEALRAANDHIADLEDELSRTAPAAAGGERPRGFLDGMRDTLFGRDEARHGGGGSVPPVGRGQPMGAPRGYGGGGDAWGGGREAAPGYGNAGPGGPGGGPGAGGPGAGGPGGGFLGTAAAVAAGAIGGSLLMGGIRSALGSQSGQSGAGGAGGGPFGGVFDQLVRGAGGSGGSSRVDPNSSLAQDAGLGDVARGGRSSFANTAESDPRKEREQPADDDEDDENDEDEDDDDLEDDYEDEDDYDDGDDDE